MSEYKDTHLPEGLCEDLLIMALNGWSPLLKYRKEEPQGFSVSSLRDGWMVEFEYINEHGGELSGGVLSFLSFKGLLDPVKVTDLTRPEVRKAVSMTAEELKSEYVDD